MFCSMVLLRKFAHACVAYFVFSVSAAVSWARPRLTFEGSRQPVRKLNCWIDSFFGRSSVCDFVFTVSVAQGFLEVPFVCRCHRPNGLAEPQGGQRKRKAKQVPRQ